MPNFCTKDVEAPLGGGLHKSENLFEKIISLENLLPAWREFGRGKRSKADVQNFEMFLEDNILALHQELKGQSWRPSPYKAFYISDPKLRHIHKACVRDRVVHQAVFRLLYPIFDQSFIFDSYSCRLEKGTHKAVRRLETFCRRLSKNYRLPVFALKCDIKKFFDSIDHKVLRRLIFKEVKDEKLADLINLIIGSFSASPGKGLPLGNVTSQLFANIYMNEFDQFVKHGLKARHYIRYTDDFLFLSSNKNYLKSLLPDIENFFDCDLGLKLHPEKIILRKLSQGIDFLGYVVLPRHIVLRIKTKRRIFRKLSQKKQLLGQGLPLGQNYYQSLQSYLGALSHCNGHGVKQKLIRAYWDTKPSLL